jgi:hypothetical protein
MGRTWRRMRWSNVSLAVSLAILAACEGATSGADLVEPPAEVKASFKQFTDSVIPRMQDSLFRTGFRHFDPAIMGESTSPVAFRADLPSVSPADAKADIYEGVVEGDVMRNGDATAHWPVSLHFGRLPGTSKWILLTSAGYPDDGQPRTPASAPRMPLLAIASVVPHFTDVREWQWWWEQTEKRREQVK